MPCRASGSRKWSLASQPPQVTGLIDALRVAGAAGAGLDSFGPAVYAVGDTGMTGIERAAQEFMRENGGGFHPFLPGHGTAGPGSGPSEPAYGPVRGPAPVPVTGIQSIISAGAEIYTWGSTCGAM